MLSWVRSQQVTYLVVNHPQVEQVQVVGTRTKEVGTRTKVLAQEVPPQGQVEARTQMVVDHHNLGRLATQVLASNRTTKVVLLLGMVIKVSQVVEVVVLA